MKIEVKKLDGTRRELNIEVSGEAVKNKFEEVFKGISAQAKVPGFRPGHAPRDIVEKHFSASVHEQVMKELIPEFYNQAIEKEGLEVIELPDISDVKLDRTLLSFKARVEVSPEIKLKDYKGIRVNYKRIGVAPEEIKRNVDSFKEVRKAENANDHFARGLGYLDLTELEKAVEKQIYIQKDNLQRQGIENQLIEALTADLDFKLPASLINRQLQDLIRQAKLDLVLKGLPREKVEEEEKKLPQELEPHARRQVKIYLVLSAIAKKENIPLDEHMSRRVMEFLLRQADWQETH